MSVKTHVVDEQLRLSPAAGGLYSGVLVFEVSPKDIPRGASVVARLHRPYELSQIGQSCVNDHVSIAVLETPAVPVGPAPWTITMGHAGVTPGTVILQDSTSVPAMYFTDDGKGRLLEIVAGLPVVAGAIAYAAGVITIAATSVPWGLGPTLTLDYTYDYLLYPATKLPQGYQFEQAPLPASFTTAGGYTFRSRARVLEVLVGAPTYMRPYQFEPTWAAFAAPQTGTLIPGGKRTHMFTMPDLITPAVEAETERRLMRVRWTGSVVAPPGVHLGAPLVAASTMSGTSWASSHTRLVPGSILVVLPAPADTLRDNGAGRLVGEHGDGTVDYITGEYSFRFNPAQTGQVHVSYEYDCVYAPIDVHVEYDSELP